ncbi:Ankyrin repeat and SOCS box protein 2 [Bagarius yarrelli]|uniref:Ankyrin repeat and SOCS box protein 2 n=1 Tax=Bagarius yarrelli TaxID=175774 RepID=A0A556U508_BAGYA|nr:Ankyrin repeat and SOCS box protein 2 [Bagarius yarrelli]
MTRFSYAEYLSLFRSSGVKSHREGFDSGARCEDTGDVTAAPAQEPLMLAIRRGDVQAVIELASSISCIQTHSAVEDWTALHEAAYYGQTACVKALLKACQKESIDIVQMILAFGGLVNQRCHQGWTALHEAVRRGNTQLCEALLQARAAIDATNAYGITPIIEAARHGRTKIVEYLISKGAGVNLQSCEGTTALSEACKHGHGDTVDLLLRHHADANKSSKTGFLPLHIAAQYGHENIVCLLLPVTSRAKIRQSGITPLHLAAEFNQENVVRFLIKSGCDVNTKLSRERSSMFHDHRSTALYCAVTASNVGVVDMLLKAGANPNLDPLSPLLVALRQGCLRTIHALVEHGADVNANVPAHPTDFPGALLYTRSMRILQYLLDNGLKAEKCFRCDHTNSQQATRQNRREDTGHRTYIVAGNTFSSPSICTESTNSNLQFCEWVSSVSHMAVPLITLLLDYVGNIQLCCKVIEEIKNKEEWAAIKEKASSPRPLMHLCRLKVREQVGTQRLTFLNTLPLPGRLLHYLRCSQDSTTEYTVPSLVSTHT